MPNRNYINGKAREQRLKKALLSQGFEIVVRSAGSKSCIDLIAIDIKNKRINFIQAKPNSMSQAEKERINKANSNLNDEFICRFFTISNIQEMDKNEG